MKLVLLFLVVAAIAVGTNSESLDDDIFEALRFNPQRVASFEKLLRNKRGSRYAAPSSKYQRGRRYNSFAPNKRPSMSPFNRVGASEEMFGRSAAPKRGRGRSMQMTRIPGDHSDELFGK